MFEREFTAAWMHMDANGHMANTAFLEVAVDVRFAYFASKGMPPEAFHRHGIGPVVRRDEVDYHREIRLLEPFRVNLLLAGLAEDASRFRIVNEVRRGDGQLAARITSEGGYLDLAARKLVVPPEALARALREIDRTPDFTPLPSSIRK